METSPGEKRGRLNAFPPSTLSVAGKIEATVKPWCIKKTILKDSND